MRMRGIPPLVLWNEKYRDGIKTRGDNTCIGMDLCTIKPSNDVRRKFSADHYAYIRVTQALFYIGTCGLHQGGVA